ncbi:Rho GTPase activation protein [Artomyces pyxidatus]|uniref:Rho GTPase activation protein n=1 Tax=Artomyces pyxidatus TaxID=48021 RepID=A0ACB8TIC4_9AGAM|nr:Rho GTPase activation protein [Artomyces pyxidatus]
MADAWTQSSPRRSPREFFVSLEVYVSNKAAAALRKPVPRKKVDKRESSRPLSILADDNQRKVKEKTSWLSLARGSSTGDHWRQATCRLSEEGEGCLFNVYIEETILFQCVYLHLLNHTDIRLADRSLFFRKDCVGIHCAADQRWSATLTTEPLYFAFSSTEAANTWLALLRSYAAPEVYGKASSAEGGTYRIWRQVEVSCQSGRNIGMPRMVGDTPLHISGSGDHDRGDNEAVDLDLFCEIYFNNILSGRTVVKKSLGSPDWHENFLFTDLPPFEKLAIVLWREKKLLKPSVVGTVYIALTNFRRGEYVEGWFPVLYGGSTAASVQVGQIRLKLKVDEEVILPQAAYSKTLNSRNYLDWMNDFESKLKMKNITGELVAVAVAKDILLDSVFEQADREVDGAPTSHNTLFRGNTVLTKTVELLMSWYGKNFLEASIGSTIRRICAENVAIEVDPSKNTRGPRDLERNVELLLHWCQEIWDQIYAVRAECPTEMRRLFERLRHLVEKRYKRRNPPDGNRDLHWQSVSAFCFLRFIVPAILHPHLFGLCPGLPDLPVQRSLTLIAKAIQSLANLNSTAHKEGFMKCVNPFLEDSLPAMVDYLLVVSSPALVAPSPQNTEDTYARHRAAKALRERMQGMRDLHREAIPLLPHLLDVPRHLTVIASAVLRQSRTTTLPQDPALLNFYNRCSDLEQQALYRVSRIANRGAIHFEPPPPRHLVESSPPATPDSSGATTPVASSSSSARRQARPMTAPTVQYLSRPREASSDPSLSTSQGNLHSRGFSSSQVDISAEPASTPPSTSDASHEGGSWPVRKRLPPSHPRSISTDSIPSYRPPPTGGPPFLDTLQGSPEDTGRWKKGFLRGILVRK